VVTTNDIYGCDEFEDNISVYDDIEESQLDQFNDPNIYIDVVADETEKCDQNDDNKPALPGPRQNIYLDIIGFEGSNQGSRASSRQGSRNASPRGSRNSSPRVRNAKSPRESKNPSPQSSKPPRSRGSRTPSPRPDVKFQDNNKENDYEGLKKEGSDHTYLCVNDINTEECGQDNEAQD